MLLKWSTFPLTRIIVVKIVESGIIAVVGRTHDILTVLGIAFYIVGVIVDKIVGSLVTVVEIT